MTQRDRHIGTKQFEGLAGDQSPVNMSEAFAQEDVGGNHERRGSFRLRRGMEDTGFTKKPSKVLNVVGFETANGEIAYMIAAGTTLYDGELTLTAEGFGTGGFGSQGFGD